MDVINKLRIVTEDGTYTDDELIIKSHWNGSTLIELIIGDKGLFLDANNLKIAIDNATNHGD